MARELNKHTPNSEELFKRLESNDPGGLDDFEKEALEGFDSLEDIDLAKKLTANLNQKIDERFFEKEEKKGGSSPWKYLSIAAGLVLIIGLTVFFMNIMSSKKELAAGDHAPTDKVVNEVSKPNDLAPAQESKLEEKNTAGDTKPSEVISETKANGPYSASQPVQEEAGKKNNQDETGLRSRMVLKEPKKPDDPVLQNAAPKTADAESDDLKQQTDKNVGPLAGYATTSGATGKGKEEERAEKSAVYKEANNRSNNAADNSVAAGGTKDLSKKSESQTKEKAKANGEQFANDQKAPAVMDETTVTSANSAKVTVNKHDEHNAEFESAAFARPQDYIKNEIDKSEMLRENVKSFKAELTIDEKGKVKAVKFLTKFADCKGCETEMRKILLNMSGWKSDAQGRKMVKETISYSTN